VRVSSVRGFRIDEQDFGIRLEFHICAEFEGFRDKHLRAYWCDSLVAEDYDLSAAVPCVRGRAWCGPSGQERWRFTLILDPGTRRLDWLALLPDDGLTGWVSPDPQARTMTIDPLGGYPD
jgi:hypothetical protein